MKKWKSLCPAVARSLDEAGLDLLTFYAAALTLLYGLVAFGQIVLPRIDGHERFPAFLAKEWSQAA